MLWEEHEACIKVKNDDELISIINQFSKKRENIFYKNQNIKNYLNEIQGAELGGSILRGIIIIL